MEASQYSIHHEEAEIAGEITRNYEQLLHARERAEPALVQTFEQRMNGALERYGDLVRFSGQAMLLGQPEGA